MKTITEVHTLQVTYVNHDASDEAAAEVERMALDPDEMNSLAKRFKHILGADDVQISKTQLFIGGENNG